MSTNIALVLTIATIVSVASDQRVPIVQRDGYNQQPSSQWWNPNTYGADASQDWQSNNKNDGMYAWPLSYGQYFNNNDKGDNYAPQQQQQVPYFSQQQQPQWPFTNPTASQQQPWQFPPPPCRQCQIANEQQQNEARGSSPIFPNTQSFSGNSQSLNEPQRIFSEIEKCTQKDGAEYYAAFVSIHRNERLTKSQILEHKERLMKRLPNSTQTCYLKAKNAERQRQQKRAAQLKSIRSRLSAQAKSAYDEIHTIEMNTHLNAMEVTKQIHAIFQRYPQTINELTSYIPEIRHYMSSNDNKNNFNSYTQELSPNNGFPQLSPYQSNYYG